MASSCSICTSICWPARTVTAGAEIRKFPAQPPLASTFPSARTQAGMAHELIPGGPAAPGGPAGTRPGTPRAASPMASPAATPARAAHRHTMRRRPGLTGVRISIMAVGRVPRAAGFRWRPNRYTGTALTSPGTADQGEPRRSSGAIKVATTRHEIVSPRRNAPSRGVATTTTPNHRPRISQPPAQTSTPVSSSRHNCHRSSRCTMPATEARYGRAPASRRAAINVSAGVKTLTTTAWAYVELDGHQAEARGDDLDLDLGAAAGTLQNP